MRASTLLKTIARSAYAFTLLIATARARPDPWHGPWDLTFLKTPPVAQWASVSASLSTVYYQSVPQSGVPTRVFGYYAQPTNIPGPYPALLLVHGGGMTAVADWALFWANRGYAALAMDLNGQDPSGHMADGGPPLLNVYTDVAAPDLTTMWVYHAVAAVIRGHSLLAAQPQVDPHRIGVHGISWGGFITSITAGRVECRGPSLRRRIPRGRQFYFANLLVGMTPALRARWVRNFDPSTYLAGATCPMLFVTGATDPYFSVSCFQHSSQLVPQQLMTLSIHPPMTHGWIWTMPWTDVEVRRFVDATLLGRQPLTNMVSPEFSGGQVRARFAGSAALASAQLFYTTNLGAWTNRAWVSQPAAISSNTVIASVPSIRPLACFLGVTDDASAWTTTPCTALGSGDTPADVQLRLSLPDAGGPLTLIGSKPAGHRVRIDASTNATVWVHLTTNYDAGDTMSFSATNTLPLLDRVFRGRDLDW